MAWHRKRNEDADHSALLRDYEEEIHALLVAFLNEEKDIDIRIAALVAGKPEHLRAALMRRLHQRIQEEKEDKAHELEETLREQQQSEAKEINRQSMNRWVAYFISQRTMRRIREMILNTPALANAIASIGRDMANRGVSYQHRDGLEHEVGQLSASVQKSRDQGRDAGKGRGA